MTGNSVTGSSVTGNVVVTGAASGIGLALADQLSVSGATVFALDRRDCPLGSVHSIVCDLTDPASIGDAVAALPPDIAGLANVAGVPGTAAAQTVLTVNLLGARLLTGQLLPRMAAGTAIVNVASVAAHRNTQSPDAIDELLRVRDCTDLQGWLRDHPVEGPDAYDTSKRALIDWTQLLSAKLNSHGIRVLSVSPGPVETPILADFEASMGTDAMQRSHDAVGRHGYPHEIAAVVAFALSPAASWLNGIDIPVEGGLFATRAAAKSPVFEGLSI
ncbi:coniferyl-alcohol dehydrogenase [Rhodococcus sp. JVH1]|uniref:coniferyl-alcohol dehydrogenase n=1 Tax=Rhodococcus sp. JVH1 TaxID=745408 RepID=UPI000272269F|nr:coniferyl-alcohol dehydrogenase [Rhodococcus sp. JVH1]EJI98026.1 short chain dehydrogenase family protein [Rhodococcus sp. JVH1]